MNDEAYLSVSNAIDEKWSSLSNAEYRALRFILNRTLRYGKLSEVIPRRHILEGVNRTNQGPCGISYAQWKRCMRSLAAAGAIQFTYTPEEGGLTVEIIVQRVIRGPLGGGSS